MRRLRSVLTLTGVAVVLVACTVVPTPTPRPLPTPTRPDPGPGPPTDPHPATWALDPDEAIGPGTTEFTAWVTEQGCASGQSSAGRIVGPDIQTSTDAVVITFRVRPLSDNVVTCPGHPPAPVSVELPQPLGDRRLLDGGREPPQEPPICAGPLSCESDPE